MIIPAILATLLLSSTAPAAVSVAAEKVQPIDLARDCKITSGAAMGTLTYRVKDNDGSMRTVQRPIHGDLCRLHTAQYITKIFYNLTQQDKDPVIGVAGENEDNEALAFVNFSEKVLKQP